LLVATLGVAAVSYVACGGTSVANLMPPPQDGGTVDGAAEDTSNTDTFSPLDLVANIVAPQ
jgi:hypothetical protein